MAARSLFKSNIENSPIKSKFTTENGDTSLSSKLIEKVIFSHKNSGVDGQKVQLAKAALHISTPERMPARETEIKQIQAWVEQHLIAEDAGGMYISGSPGTGKSAVVEHVLNKLSNYKFKLVKVNCMNVRNQPNSIFEAIATQLNVKLPRTEDKIAARLVSARSKMTVLVLDEVDQLLSSNLSSSKTVLKTVFEWPLLEGCRMILIGIANALDLSTHHLPKYFTSSNFETPPPTPPSTPKSKKARKNGKTTIPNSNTNAGFLMHFTPYKKEDIAKILEDRLEGNNIFDPAAIKFVASKVASTCGDVRKALNACKLALESVEMQERRQGLKVTADDGLNPGASPKKQKLNATLAAPVGALALSKVLTTQKDEGAIPLQQAIILLTLHKINAAAPNVKNYLEDGVQSAIPIDRVYTEHLRVCEKHMFPRIDRSDLPSACSMLQDRSLITIIQRATSCSPSASSPKGRLGTLKRGLTIKTQASGQIGILFDPRSVEIALRGDPVMSQKLKLH